MTNDQTMLHNPNNFITAGLPLNEAQKVMILVHGRGGSAQDMLSLRQHLNAPSFAFVAPQATNNTWYPYSFMAQVSENEPYLSSALEMLGSLHGRLQADFNFKSTQIYWLGFSQGACLTLEFVARNATAYGGVFGLSGGLIGPPETSRNYAGDLAQTPVFLGCSDRDSHIPKNRVEESAEIFEQLGATVTMKLYPNFPHTINQDELNVVNALIT
jgi:phospholipase/carboxylesterase